ncbi:hypothetical protein EUTSA_v10001795mg [Eutrema salsugineum]|uniref:pectinesterase n=2 Tax=Eutrema salsugineum TaxID=72664 RepID=V4N2F6_EUTSA|nr:hypothetical protein EUTSA_v10001795mg [Eutrema salsugineum]
MVILLLVYKSAAEEYCYQQINGISSQIANTITVDLNGGGNYKTVQSAIDSIPLQNQNWIRILIKKGIYIEKVTIPMDKGYIYMQGRGIEKTIIAYDDHQLTDTSPTFTAYPDNIIISGITFKNTYNIGLMTTLETPVKPAVAARMLGDKYVVIDSSFDGVQDTLYDCVGRHYYKRCVISGGIDFIFGYAQSLFEGCTVNLTVGIYAPDRAYGTITAQGRQSPKDNGGFLFKDCTVTGIGKALLGRAWQPYARVIFYRSKFCNAILPIGWDAWRAKGQEGHITFVEYGCTGAGADTSQRVPWLKKASTNILLSLTNGSFINQEDWLSSLPIKY